MDMDGRSAVKSADRILELFEILAQRSDGLPHQALADALAVPKSSLTQLLKTALARGFVSYSTSDRRYRLGDRLFAIVRSAAPSQDLIALSIPILEELTAKCQESSALNFLEDDQTKVVATVNGPQRLVTHMRLGDLAPLYATSGGKIILAHLPEPDRQRYLQSVSFERITPKTIHSAAQLQRNLDEAKAEGLADSLEEFTPGIVGLAHAVLSSAGEVLASINVAMPAIRYSTERRNTIHGLLRDACLQLQRRLDF